MFLMLYDKINSKVISNLLNSRFTSTLLGLSLITFFWYMGLSAFKFLIIPFSVYVYLKFNSQTKNIKVKNVGSK